MGKKEEKKIMSDADIARILKKTYPQMDRHLYSKAKHSVMTGVRLTELGEHIVHDLLHGAGTAQRARGRIERADMRKCTIRIPEREIARLQQQQSVFGLNELNAIVNAVLCYGLEMLERSEHEKAC